MSKMETHNRQKLLLELGGTRCKAMVGIGLNGLLGGRDFEVFMVEASRDIDQETHGAVDSESRSGLAAGDVPDERVKLHAMLTALCSCVNDSGQKIASWVPTYFVLLSWHRLPSERGLERLEKGRNLSVGEPRIQAVEHIVHILANVPSRSAHLRIAYQAALEHCHFAVSVDGEEGHIGGGDGAEKLFACRRQLEGGREVNMVFIGRFRKAVWDGGVVG